MTDLVVCVGAGKGTWAEVYKLLQAESWETVYVVTNDFGKEKFKLPEKGEFIVLDENASIQHNIIQLIKRLENNISFNEIALSLVSGTGKQHMEILAALVKLGANMRLVTIVENRMQEL